MRRTEVHKFGGTSVGGAERITACAQLIHEAADATRIVVVASAMHGVTDRLVEAALQASRGDREAALGQVAAILALHLETLERLHVESAAVLRAEMERICGEMEELIRATVLLGELTPRSRDRLLACGEKLSCRLLAATLSRRGALAEALDTDTFLETDANFGEANPLLGVADRAVQARLGPLLDGECIPVLTGFSGQAPDGATTTLGRGGSDLSATFIAAAIRADVVVIWTDVDGVFSADPRVVHDAEVIPHLNYREAAEMSYYGAKVLHQRCMIPLVQHEIPVRIRNSFRPTAPGTLVDRHTSRGSHPVKAISAIRAQSLISVEGKGMSGVPGVAARLFQALADQSISVTMISQSSSESSICLALPQADARAAETALKRAFRADISRGAIEEIEVLNAVGLVAAVGLGMAHTPGIAARLFGALARNHINVLAVAQGSSELNISLAVEADRVDTAVEAIHREFGLHRLDTGEDAPACFDILLLGLGKIGRDLIRLIEDRESHILERFGRRPRIVAVCDRSGFLFRPTGLGGETLRAAAQAKRSGHALSSVAGAQSGNSLEMVQAALRYRLTYPVLVDVSDADDSAEVFVAAFRSGCDVVTANKKPLAGGLESYRAVIRAARTAGRIVKAEATVGAGLPVVDSLEMLLATGDRLTRAEGCLSGTLAFIMSRLEAGIPFSTAVAEAVELGYTEPDPVTDLSGVDVARKAVILGRLSGLVCSDEPVRLEGLVDPVLAGMTAAELGRRLAAAYDAPLAARIQEARAGGRALRYVARVEAGRIEVGPVVVAPDSPLGMLQGTDNMIVFHSERYAERPLVVTGPGAGVEVTSMGVLGDILRVLAERRSA